MVATGGGTFADPQNRAAINGDGVSVWLDVPLDRLIARVPADGRRPLAADRAGFERLYHHRRAAYEQAHVRLDAGRAGVDALVEQLVDWLATLMRYLILTDIHANLEALDACLADARARGTTRRWCSAISSATAPIPNAVIDRVQASQSHRRSCAATTTRWRAASSRPKGSTPSRRAPRTGRFEVLMPAHRDWLAALPEGRMRVDDVVEICHGSPFDEDAYIFDELDAVRALKVAESAAAASSATRITRSRFELSAESFDSVGPSAPRRDRTCRMQDGCKVSDQPGIGRPAARRRSARRLRDRRHSSSGASSCFDCSIASKRRRRR